MLAPNVRLCLWIGPLAILGPLVLVVMNPRGPAYVALGYLFGTLFGQATFPAAWTAFGPFPLIWRLPLSLCWLGLLGVALAINIGLHDGPEDLMVVIGGCLLGQWALVQLPFWGLAILYGARLRHWNEADRPANPRERQFGIRQLMIFTAIVGVVFGIGRFVVVSLAPRFGDGLGNEAPIFIFLVVAAIGLTLPLLLAMLMPRFAAPAVVLTLVLIGLATAGELPLLNIFHKRAGPDMFHLIWINGFTAGWILLLALIVRLNGFRLAAPSQPASPPSPT